MYKPTIRNTRRALNLTQKQFAPLMGMSQPGIARIESGERTETVIHRRLLTAITVLHTNGFLDKYIDETQRTE